MTVLISVQRAAISATAGGSVNVTDSTVFSGATPEACRVWLVPLTSGDGDNSAVSGAHMSYGFFDGTNSWCTGFVCEDAQATTDTARFHNTTYVGRYVTSTGGKGLKLTASMIADGVRLTSAWDSGVTLEAFQVVVELIGGTDVSAHVGTMTGPSSGATDITAPGFKPHLVHIASCRNSSASDKVDHAAITVGIAINDSHEGVVCKSYNWYSEDKNSQKTEVASRFDNGAILFNTNTANSFEGGHELTTFDNDGFSIAFESGTATTQFMGYLALQFGDNTTQSHGVYLGNETSPTSTGIERYQITNSWVPQSCFVVTCRDNGTDVDNFGEFEFNGSFGMGLWGPSGSGTAEYYVGVSDENWELTSDAYTIQDSKIVNQRRDSFDTTDDYVAIVDSTLSNGLQLDYSAVDPGAKDFLMLLIEENGVTAITGSGSGAVGGLEGDGAGKQSITGSGSGSVGGLAADGAGSQSVSGSGSGAVSGLSGDGSGTQALAGTGGGTLGGLQGDGTGSLGASGSGTGAVGGVEGAGAGTQGFTGAGTGALGGLEGSGAGLTGGVAGSGTGSASGLSAAGAGKLEITGSGAGAVSGLAGGPEEIVSATGSGSGAVSGLTGSGTGTRTIELAELLSRIENLERINDYLLATRNLG